jgi:hypothetical protein
MLYTVVHVVWTGVYVVYTLYTRVHVMYTLYTVVHVVYIPRQLATLDNPYTPTTQTLLE